MNDVRRHSGTGSYAPTSIKKCGTVANPPQSWVAPERAQRTAWVAGSDAPEKAEIKIGFLPLTDCASIIIASVLGFDRKYGLRIVPSKEASWATVRDKLLNGQIDAAQVLYGLIYAVHMGIAGPKRDMAVLMSLNQNGQGITLARSLQDQGITTGEALASLYTGAEHRYTFAHTFPTGTHAMWLYYWLASYGINPLSDVETITVPPPQMVEAMHSGKMQGACVGEPWNALAIYRNVGFTVANSQDVWPGHPEKALGTTLEFVQRYPNTARALVMAVLDASRYVDAKVNRAKVAAIIADPTYVDAPMQVIESRLRGVYENGIGKKWVDPYCVKFFADGKVNFPYLSDGMWFLTQHRRWGLLQQDGDFTKIARRVNQIELYKEAASQLHVPVPESPMRRSVLLDGAVWDGTAPDTYAASFPIRWKSQRVLAEA